MAIWRAVTSGLERLEERMSSGVRSKYSAVTEITRSGVTRASVALGSSDWSTP
jgi:hypothetical protein